MWNSYHFFSYDFDKMNHCLKTAVATLPPSFLKDMFYIRYWHGGPHLRFRVRNQHNPAVLVQSLSRYWDQYGQNVELDASHYYAPYRKYFNEEEGDILYPAGQTVEIDYKREVERYGGEQGIELCETYFCKDSQNILNQLSENAANNEKSLYFYALAYAKAASTLGLNGLSLLDINGISPTSETRLISERVSQLFDARRTAYLNSFEGFQRGSTSSQYDIVVQDLVTLINALSECSVNNIEVVLHSLLHMSFNRAGVAPFKESTIRYFAYLSYLSFGEEYALKAS